MAALKIKPIKFTEHFYQLGTPFFPVYLSVGKEAMLIEGGTGGVLALVKEQLHELGINPERIKYVVLTHSHPDHIGLVPHIQSEWKEVKVLAGKATAQTLADEKALEPFLKLDQFIAERLKSLGEISEMPPKLERYEFKVDRIIAENENLDLGDGIHWTIYEIPGHSPCQIALFEKKEGSLVVGDAAGLYFPKVDEFWPEYFLSLEQYCNGIRRLAALPGHRTALSHFGVIEGDSKAFLRKSLEATEKYHLQMLDRVKKGEDPNQISKELTDWIHTNHNYMPYEAGDSMCRLMIKRSQKEADKADLFKDI